MSGGGKVRSANRQNPLAHADDVRAIAKNIASNSDAETQLYLTDYRSLYVAHVLEIRDEEISAAERDHTPPYYEKDGFNCDFWFKLGDVRRIVVDDMPAVIRELKLLRNVHYADRPVSIYGGMVDLPLIVIRPDGHRFFDEDERERLIGDQLWAEFDALQGSGLAATERTLREDMLGDNAWWALDLTARAFIAAAERDFLAHRADAAFDFMPVIVNFAKALEVQCNSVLRQGLAKAPPSARQAKVQDRTVDVTIHRPLMLRVATLAAAALHDTVEDTDTTSDEIGALFGAEVQSLVREVTDDKSLEKDHRKQLQIVHAHAASPKAKQIKIADKICNVGDIALSPPVKWSLERRLAYVDWADKVMTGLRGDNRTLDASYDSVAQQARETLGALQGRQGV